MAQWQLHARLNVAIYGMKMRIPICALPLIIIIINVIFEEIDE